MGPNWRNLTCLTQKMDTSAAYSFVYMFHIENMPIQI